MPITNKIPEAKVPSKRGKNHRAEVIVMKEKLVDKELERAREKFSKVINFVNDYYNETLPEKQKETFDDHNSQILKLVIEKGLEKKLDESQMDLLEIGAIMHDMYKSESAAPEWAKGINQFMMVYHGEMAALMVGSEEVKKRQAGKKQEDWEVDEEWERKRRGIRKMLKEALGEENFEEKMEQLQDVFITHMGPGEPVINQDFYEGELPFMADELGKVKKTLKEKGLGSIEHPKPEKDDIISNVMRAADMYSLSSPVGVRKMLIARFFVEKMQNEDKELIAKYKKFNITITMGEAALISALTTTRADRDMLPEKEFRDWVQEAINKTMDEKFFYGLDEKDPVERLDDPDKVWKKVKLYKKLVRQEKEDNVSKDGQGDAREKIDQAA